MRLLQRQFHANQAVLQILLLHGVGGAFELLALQLRSLLHCSLAQIGQVELDTENERFLLL